MPADEVNKIENENRKKSFKWIIGIVLVTALLAGGGYLVYKFWPKKSPEQVQQDQAKKDELREQIKLIEDTIAQGKIALENKKAGQEYKFKTLDEFPPEVVFSNPDKEVRELKNKKVKVWNEWSRLHKEIRSLISQQNQEFNNKNSAVWNKQKNGQWTILTEELDKDSVVKAKVNQLITTFYHRYKEAKKNIPTHPATNFKGFSHFYIDKDAENGRVAEMGSTEILGAGSKVQTSPTREIIVFPLQIRLNQLYLLNNGRNPGGRMTRFFSKDPTEGKTIHYLEISFDKFIQTIAHEIAHAFQDSKNVSEDKIIETGGGVVDFGKLSDCYESGEGERDEDYKLIKPKNPELVKEHKQFELEIEQMIKSDTELFPSFKAWWEAGVPEPENEK